MGYTKELRMMSMGMHTDYGSMCRAWAVPSQMRFQCWEEHEHILWSIKGQTEVHMVRFILHFLGLVLSWSSHLISLLHHTRRSLRWNICVLSVYQYIPRTNLCFFLSFSKKWSQFILNVDISDSIVLCCKGSASSPMSVHQYPPLLFSG